MTKPFSPTDLQKEAESFKIPDYVIQAVNELLLESCKGLEKIPSTITIKELDIIEKALSIANKNRDESCYLNSNHLYENKFLNFEPTFKREGWLIERDAPAYYESYSTFYIFKHK